MSSGGGQQTSSTELPAWMQPTAQTYLNRAVTVSNKPYTPYGGQTVAGLDPRTNQGLDMQAQLGQNGTAAGNAGQQALTDTLGGKYLDAGNPYLGGQIDAAQQDVIRNYNTAVKPQTEAAGVRSGSFGNSGLQQMQQMQQGELQRNLGNISTQMRGNAYNTERGYQQQALGLAPQYSTMAFNNARALQDAGTAQQTQQQTQLNDSYQRWMEQQGYDAAQIAQVGNALAALRGTGGVTTQSGGPSVGRGASALGGAATGAYIGSAVPGVGTAIGAGLGGLAGYMSSDRRLKTDIKKVGKTNEGLGVYTYRYKTGGPMQMGVMAQEVEKIRPEAVARDSKGMRAVNYGLLGD